MHIKYRNKLYFNNLKSFINLIKTIYKFNINGNNNT